MKPHPGWTCTVAASALLSLTAVASLADADADDAPTTQPADAPPADTDAPTTQPADASPKATAAPTTQPPAATPSAEHVMQELLQQSQPPAPIQPTVRPGQPVGSPPVITRVDPAILGTAPGGQLPTLRREGDFVRVRRGRLVASPDGIHSLFVFEADDHASPEPPMILLPCQMLENMEGFVRERGDKVVFILSGQITTYRGANYVLPTMMKPALDNPNLR